MYPGYAPEIPEDKLVPLLTHRLGQMINASPGSAKYYLATKQNGEVPTNFEAIPIAQPHVRLKLYQELWDATPARSVKGYAKCGEDEQVPIYRENTRERLAILSEVRKELARIGIESSEKYANPEVVDNLLTESDFLSQVPSANGDETDVDP